MSTCVGLILFNFRKHPIEIARGYLAAAEFANAGSVYLKRRATIRTIQVRACGRRPGSAIPYKRPIFAPAAHSALRTAHDPAAAVDCIVVTFGPDAQRDSVVKSILFDLHRLHRRNL